MRLVQVIIPAGKREAVLRTLDDEGIDYVVTDETSGREYVGVAYFPLPTNAVEPVLASLREVGLDDQAYTVVLSAETVVSRRFEALKQEYEESDDNGTRIAREELKARAEDLASSLQTYTAMTVISAVIAAAGLLLDSPATVVGSMVIAPLIGPAMAAAVGTVVDDSDLFARGVKLQAFGMSLAVLAAAAFGLLVQVLNLVPPGIDPTSIEQVRERLSPDFLSLAVALGSGTAGALSLTTGVSTALVGVMIAVALVPPAAAVGLSLAFQQPGSAVSAGVLAVVNGLSINLAALVVLWWQGYRPEHFFRTDAARAATVKRVGVLVAAIAVLSLFLGGVTYDSFQTARTEQQVQAAITDVMGEETYADLVVLDTEVRTRAVEHLPLLNRADAVVVTVGVPPGGTTDGLAAALADRIEATTGQDLDVQVRYVAVERAS
ncbi:TIGR00341 family protein [Natronomonas sp. EA1]|uniref:TIGR00341 family protein n=1 Tax=Natronomonas sp. EA1 TaxID=3421655 RepID=UPI003EB9D1FE